jgi:hypothetical protein
MKLKTAYLILAHENPAQLLRLLRRLNGPGSYFFLHVDKRVPDTAFAPMFTDSDLKIIPVTRENTQWGGLGIVKATLNGLRQICAYDGSFDFIHLISGADYPIVSNAKIDDFLAARVGKIFMEMHRMPVDFWPHGGMRRIEWYNFIRIQHYSRWKSWTLSIANKILTAIPWLRRRHPSYVSPFGGSQWWSISLPAARYILRFVDEHPDYLRFHRHTLAPDECFFQSILGSAVEPSIKSSLINDNLRHIVWAKPGVTKFPLVLTMDDFDGVVGSGKLWTRKVRLDTDSKIFDALDRLAS